MAIKLIVGLGNPGSEYEHTRHNAGFWLIDEIAAQHHITLQAESKFYGLAGRITLFGQDVRLLKPNTFMNKSGQAVAALANFYKIDSTEIIVAHDELDMPAGTAKFKQGGGHGGHNGLRDIISHLANQKDFYRLRLGIGHPGSASKVTGYVLGKPSAKEREQINNCIDQAIRSLEAGLKGNWAKAMQELHSFSN